MSPINEPSNFNDFDGYIRQGEPSQVEKSQIWKTAIGLQQVDGLTPSAYLIETAKANIEGKIALPEVQYRIDSYYKQQCGKNVDASNKYLEYFLGNMLLGEKHELKNRYLHINFTESESWIDTTREKNFPESQEMFPVKGEKFLVNGKMFPVIGLKIIDCIKNKSTITIMELSQLLKVSDRAVKNNLNKLKSAEIIKRVGADKGGHWEVIEKGGSHE